MTLDIATILAGASPLTLVFAWLYVQEKGDHKETQKKFENLVDRLLKKAGHDV
jgi:hypothetical protein